MMAHLFIQGVSEEIVNILGGGNMDYSEEIVRINMCPIFNGYEDTAI
jgi:hypothetical protein